MRKKDNNILIGITGSIAAYKTLFLISNLKKEGYNVKCLLTKSATNFVTSLSIQTLSQNKVFTDINATNEQHIEHIDLVKWANLIVIAPTTANFIAKTASGIADDMLTSLYLANNYKVPIIIAPAMNKEMWDNPITQKNISTLKKHGVEILMPTHGLQACGDVGLGRMIEPEDIAQQINNKINGPLHLKDKTMLITAGPTIEPIDPVRYISNRSSGKMGYALANAAIKQGAKVTLITGPTKIEKPNCNVINVNTADEMYHEVKSEIKKADIFIAAAAVSDYKPKQSSNTKIKKKNHEIDLCLVKNQDILKEVSTNHPNKIIVGFAAETCDLESNAIKKLQDKKLDLIIANDASAINSDNNQVLLINKNGKKEAVPLSSKHKVADNILRSIRDLL